MIVIFGVKDKNEVFDSHVKGDCKNCNNEVVFQKVKSTSWITLFFIRIIPFRKRYLSMCPICNIAIVVKEEEFEKNEFSENDAHKYHGKTETQIAFLKQKEEMEKLNR